MIQSETLDLLEWSRLCQHLSTFCATKLGAIAARQLQLPTTQADSEYLLAQTKEAYAIELSVDAGIPFGGITDIGGAIERAQLQGLLSGEECNDIASTLAGARQIRRTIDSLDDLDLPVLTALISELRTHPELEKEIHRCVDERGSVTDRASPDLERIRSQLKSTRDRIQQTLYRLIQRHASALQEHSISMRGDRYVVPVKAGLQGEVPGIVHDISSSGSTFYIEPKVIVNDNNQLRTLQRQERQAEEVVLRALSVQVAEVAESLEQLLAIVTTIDLAVARARYAYWLEANPPRFVAPDEPMNLRTLRHPLLVWQHKHENGTPVVAIDAPVRSQTKVVAITGPNTGGKTVTLKSIGLAALMARCGLFIPAREPVEICWFGQILADIGDEQSLQQSLSTFSGHIRRISRILATLPEPVIAGIDSPSRFIKASIATPELSELAESPESPESPDLPEFAELSESSDLPAPTPPPANALVLLDEVGAGTDPTEGSALAIALLKTLADRARLTIATTHFGELKTLKYQDDRFENASVEFDDVSLKPTYRLLWGIPGRSNALAIARRLGLDPHVLDLAEHQIAPTGVADVNQTIAELEAERRRQEAKANEAQQLVTQAERLNREISQKAEQLKLREAELKQQQEEAVRLEINQAKGEIAKVIRQLQRSKDPTAQTARVATETINDIAQTRLPSQTTPKPQPGFKPKLGDRVRIPRLGQTAEVLSDVSKDNELTVRFGLMKMTIALAEIESLDGKKPDLPEPKPKAKTKAQAKQAKTEATQKKEAPIIRTSKNTLDVRGSRISEAEQQLEAAIAEAVPIGGALWIIHGKGTGKLRLGVHELLTRSPYIDRFELAAQNDGGTGVTIAYLN
ncbi:MAG: endonuclease MutS2 [Coleofasciculaceae cyanobacterium RL_1_1]|nr:endonuclease MutS2 [Coleofasciculaceae cyanobacterium RL_1_1]